LGRILLADLMMGQVQAMFTAIIRQHEALGAPASAATLHRIRATLWAALNAAIRRGLIADDPATRVELPGARRPRAVVWTTNRIEHWRRTGERPAVAVWTAAQTAEFPGRLVRPAHPAERARHHVPRSVRQIPHRHVLPAFL
jgi:riboflavin biosynthesis pyrimidine reductase